MLKISNFVDVEIWGRGRLLANSPPLAFSQPLVEVYEVQLEGVDWEKAKNRWIGVSGQINDFWKV